MGKERVVVKELVEWPERRMPLSGLTRARLCLQEKASRRAHSGRCMGVSERVTRGILIGGALGAFSHIFGITENLFMAVGIGAIAGCLAGLTRALVDKKRK